ncbi:hypothetical protein BH23CHL4_BH23CHL4_08440 [soil metagenome]
MLRTAQLRLLEQEGEAGLRHRAFPPGTASLLPGLLAVTRTGLAPAGNDELQRSLCRNGITSISGRTLVTRHPHPAPYRIP